MEAQPLGRWGAMRKMHGGYAELARALCARMCDNVPRRPTMLKIRNRAGLDQLGPVRDHLSREDLFPRPRPKPLWLQQFKRCRKKKVTLGTLSTPSSTSKGGPNAR